MILTRSHKDSLHYNHHPFEEMTLEAFLSENAVVTDDDVAAIAPLHNHHLVPHQFPQVPAVEDSSSSAAKPFANGMLRWQVKSQHRCHHQEEAMMQYYNTEDFIHL
ncbi:hypothetical protein HN51_071042 [Arachis hypogaea]